jgi:hypothetical protein
VTVVLAALIAVGGALIALLDKPETNRPYRAFSSSSYWNTPLPPDAPADQHSNRIIAFIQQTATSQYLRLAGANSAGNWGNPIYWASADDPAYTVRNSCPYSQPPEFASIRIPLGARPDPTSDSAMTVYDLSKDVVYAFHRASYSTATDEWTACGGAVYYLASNGLHGDLRRSDEDRNRGHRGAPPPTFAVRYDEVQHGSIEHVLKIAVPRTKCTHVFPMINDECGTLEKYAPPEGTRIRIKPSIDLSTFDLSPQAMTIARALQEYGAVIGDQSGGPASLKLENTVAEGHGDLWTGLLGADSLSAIPLKSYEAIRLGFDPTHD